MFNAIANSRQSTLCWHPSHAGFGTVPVIVRVALNVPSKLHLKLKKKSAGSRHQAVSLQMEPVPHLPVDGVSLIHPHVQAEFEREVSLRLLVSIIQLKEAQS